MANRLAHESSPYLLQHAHNPVDWWPWCDEAFAEAVRRDVPVFLSIGYSTCYWCHVMERESFENPEIAAQLNPRFVCIKVDREERPDVDEIYMAATVITSGQGGWPMTVFLDPGSRRPFYCGTYFPAQSRPEYGRPGLPQVLDAMTQAWTTQRTAVVQQAVAIAEAVQDHFAGAPQAQQLGQAQVTDAVSGLLRTFDRVKGGFGKAPKFPQPVFLEFLLDVRDRAADDSTIDAIDEAIRRTLNGMMAGGIFDHVGGGFHRYSVDADWTVPHFEKMLYDNAQLAVAYARAAAFYGDTEYARTARRTLDFVLRELTDPATGAFYSALDAEVDTHEGLNYLWSREEITRAIPDPEDAELACRAYGLTLGPNFQDPHHPESPPSNIPRLSDRADRVAAVFNMVPQALNDRLDRINAALLNIRNARPQPRRDDKIIASWNGLMIDALARASSYLDAPQYLAHARRAADALLATMLDGDQLLRTRRNDQRGARAVLEDYACLIQGLLSIHRAQAAPGGGTYLAAAQNLLHGAQSRFFGDQGAIFDVPSDAADLFVRTRSTHDGALPSGMSVMLHNLLDLSEITADPAHRRLALDVLAASSAAIAQSPTGAINSTRALLRLLLAADESAALTRDANPASTPSPQPEPVEVYAAVDRVKVGPDHPAHLTLAIRIAEGWHVPAASQPATSPPVVPFRVGIINGGGVAAYADYPEGEDFAAPGQAPIRIYKGSFELSVVLEHTGPHTGRPLLAVSFQPCNDSTCLAPQAVELDIAIDS